MLGLNCDLCNGELNEPGGLIFSPPVKEAWLVEKYHVCADCWPAIEAVLKYKEGNTRTNQETDDV